ncbi:MAG: hypothetical protein AAGA30_20930, partial [Planctomycetota bacterium]
LSHSVERLAAGLFKNYWFSIVFVGLSSIALIVLGIVYLNGCLNFQKALDTSLLINDSENYQQSTTDFDARQWRVMTNFRLEKGARYSVKIVPSSDPWYDYDKQKYPATPNGFINAELGDKPVFQTRRYRDKPMYKVLGRIEPGGREVFEIGCKAEITADSDGLLVLFINDTYGFYHNNVGKGKIKIKRID